MKLETKNKKNILCSICMRGGSKGVKNKHLRKINKKTLIWHSIFQAKKSNLFNKIVVSTDSREIQRISLQSGADKVFIRPQYMARDHSPKLPVIRHVFKKAENFYKKNFDVLIDLDATSPLRVVKDIRNAYKLFIKNKSPNLISACLSKKNPYFNIVECKNKKIIISKKLLKIPGSRQQAPITYDMNASIYIWNRKTILKTDELFFKNTSLYLMPEERSIDIDSELDFKLVKWLMEKDINEKK